MKRLLPVLAFLLGTYAAFAQMPVDAYAEAQRLVRSGNYSQAIPLLQKLSETDSLNNNLALELGIAHQRIGNSLAARRTYERILKRDTSQRDALHQLGILFEKDAQYRNALAQYQKLIQMDSLNGYFQRQAALQYDRLEQDEQAIIHYEKALKINPEDRESLAELARLYLDLNPNKYLTIAGEYIERGLAKDSTSIRFLLLNSRVDFRLARFEAVVQSLEKTMAMGDSTAYFQRMLGRAYYETGRFDKSIFTFNRLINLGEETEHNYGGLGTAYLLQAKKDSSTIFNINSFRRFDQAVRLAQTRVPDYQMGMADLYELEKQPSSIKTAIKQYQAIFNNFRRPKAVFRLAQLNDTHHINAELALLYYEETLRLCKNVYSRKYSSPQDRLDCMAVDKAAARRLAELKPEKVIILPAPVAVVAQDTSHSIPDTLKKD
ncbi:tetratricopeptide repeat protein [Siphonobacter sp. SORGH_AS_0500]|uniref:tetratricopeptide repeat protein n=1 Tax=Siphonobacter sp. SORGH_AS_0500 TaxID=1864824 RepID=UPI00285B37A2|nr:tetratricopeptide repeat protein [Siphonobacter sp. SORGH_AS_0500]MDR6193796.1 tetratricopeptide (TPR) repeat protein [Siphonobacter sp. SORGH_AS_0500]